jgi:type I restriction enzyme S subunit
MTASKKHIPALRFKGFSDSWRFDKLGNVTKVTSGGTPSRSNKNYWNGNVPWVSTSLIDFNVIQSAEEYITQEGVTNSSAKMFSKGTVLMAMYGQGKTRGKVAVLGIEATTNQACAAIIPEDMLHGDFLYQNLAGRYDEIRTLSNEGGQQNLSGGIIKEIRFCFPSLLEQQKIASFLSAIDEKIQQLTRKKALLEQYKKGVMQQLFSGKLRFKTENGKAYPKWEEKRLDDVSIITMGQSPNSSSYNNNSIGMLLIQGNADISGRITNPRQWTSEPTKICEIGDLILTVRAPVGSISKSFHKACIGRGVCSIRNNEASDNEYLYQFLLHFENKWKRIEQGSTFTAVSGSDISSIQLSLPSLKEQQKIATYLSALDTKIQTVATQIAKTQEFKKGLLQKMFV